MAQGIAPGGKPIERDVLNYQEPTGPKYRNRMGPGLRGGTNFGNAGSQGKKSIQAEGSGRPGDLTTSFLNDGYDQDDAGRE